MKSQSGMTLKSQAGKNLKNPSSRRSGSMMASWNRWMTGLKRNRLSRLMTGCCPGQQQHRSNTWNRGTRTWRVG